LFRILSLQVVANRLGPTEYCSGEKACLRGEGGQTQGQPARGVAWRLATIRFTARGEPVGIWCARRPPWPCAYGSTGWWLAGNSRSELPEKLPRDALSCSTGYRHVGDFECFDLSKLSILCVRHYLAVRNSSAMPAAAQTKAVTSHHTPNRPTRLEARWVIWSASTCRSFPFSMCGTMLRFGTSARCRPLRKPKR
jgi:hypothetical protein